MMKQTSLVVALLGSACMVGGNDGVGHLAVTAESESCFDYAQFQYRGLELNPAGFDVYRAGMPSEFAVPLSETRQADIRVHWLEDHVIVDYSEVEQLDGTLSFDHVIKLVTHAVIDPATGAVSIAGLGTALPQSVIAFDPWIEQDTCQSRLSFTFARDLGTAGLAGKTALFEPAFEGIPVVDPDHLELLAEFPDVRDQFLAEVDSGEIVIVRE